jgi:ABC-type uncharacterized transport system auxiliary subunit
VRAVAIAIALAACGGTVPQTRYYQLATPAATSTSNSPADAGQIDLAIEPLETDQAYDDDRIVYRLTPYRLDYYNYHRWSSPPGALIAEFLERAFEHSGKFHTVSRDAQAAPVTLGGRVVAIEEIDKSKTAWIGHVVLELHLTDSSTGRVLWSAQYEESQPLRQQTPEGLAEALSAALHRISARALPFVADLAAQTARARPSAGGTTSRSARLKQ